MDQGEEKQEISCRTGKSEGSCLYCKASFFPAGKLTELIMGGRRKRTTYVCLASRISAWKAVLERACAISIPQNPHQRQSLDSTQFNTGWRHMPPVWEIQTEWAGVYWRKRGWALGCYSVLLIAAALQQLASALKMLETEQCEESLVLFLGILLTKQSSFS